MKNKRIYPLVTETEIKDSFWTPYLEKVRTVTLPYVLERLEGDGYLDDYLAVAGKKQFAHRGPGFSDGLLLETLRGACDMLAVRHDKALADSIERIVSIIRAASYTTDGFISTYVLNDMPDKRWGENGGNIVIQHDLYNHGALIEAAVSHYRATGETTLLDCAVRAANLICHDIGYPPKKNIVPGHSLPEEAFVRIYHLFKETRALDDYAKKMNVDPDAYLEMADFWYKARGNHENRNTSPKFSHEYNQDNVTFENAREAVGHSVRAALCYTGAADVSLAYGDGRYTKALDALWDNVAHRKLHINGGIGTRHDIEGFDTDYNLPNDAYLETCAAIALAFWAGEMNLLSEKSEYFDVFERALYNNIIDGVGEDFRHFFYQNPLVSDGGITRWEWHGCPCCPPMLMKIFGSLARYIYSYSDDTLCVNMFIGSRVRAGGIEAELDGKTLTVKSGKPLTLKIRVPEYVSDFKLSIDGKPVNFRTENGYAVLDGITDAAITMLYGEKLRRVFANPKVDADVGKVAIMNGKFLMCAEGIDNGGDTGFTVAENPVLRYDGENVVGKRADGKEFRLIPYYKWCRRTTGRPRDDRMAVWFRQENMKDTKTLENMIGGKLYEDYD